MKRSEQQIQEFVLNDHNWFRDRYYEKCEAHGTRYWTFKLALNLFLQREGALICETGIQRLRDDYGAGCSTEIFGDFLSHYGGRLVSIDISAENCDVAATIMRERGWNKLHDIVVQDSVSALKAQHDKGTKIDLLLLDSFDYPYGELLDLYGGKADLGAAIKRLEETKTEEIVAKHGDIIQASQEHCLEEFKASEPLLHENSVVIIDDTDLPGRGKGRTAIEYAVKNGWTVLLEDYQTVLVRS